MKRRTLIAGALASLIHVPAIAAGQDVVVLNPVVLPAPGRGLDFALRVSFPKGAGKLPVVLFSHGQGYTKEDYTPLTDHWAANGFVVIATNHPDSPAYGLKPDDPRVKGGWKTRYQDMERILDSFDAIEAQSPALRGRIDRSRIIAAGHSFGGHTAQGLLGAGPIDPVTGKLAVRDDPRIMAALLLAPPGQGGDDLKPFWRDRHYLSVDWSPMRKPVLVVTGERDGEPNSPIAMSVRGPDWRADAYALAPAGQACHWIVPGGTHYLGGIEGGDRHFEAGDPARLTAMQAVTTAYLKAIVAGAPSWREIVGGAVKGSPVAGPYACK